MANYNDWNRGRRSSGQDWNEDDNRTQREQQGYGSAYGQQTGNYGSGYGNDRFRDNDRYRENYQGSGDYNSDWNRGSQGSGYNRGYGNEYGRSSGSEFNRGSYGDDYSRGSGSSEFNRWGNDYNRSRGNDGNRGREDYRNGDRNWWDKTRDEVSSWFGDEDAERRRRMDDREGPNRGKGPKGYTRSDERIKEDVNDRLNDDSTVDASEIEVTVTGCEVTLTGTVNNRQEKRRAEDLAEAVSGVKNVENRIRVQESNTGTQGWNSGSTRYQSAQITGETGTTRNRT